MRRDLRRRERRTALLDAARTIATREGIEGLTIRDVANAASVGVGSVYLHFESRDHLLASLISDGLARSMFIF